MARKHRKKILAVEWTWLFSGIAAILAMTTEGWAKPHMPVIWMMGLIAFFLSYRFLITLYEINFPQPEPGVEAGAQERAAQRIGGDGITGTVAMELPQMRGRSVPTERERKRQESGGQIAIPGADGQFEDANLHTVFSYDASALDDEENNGREYVKKVGRPGLFGVTVYEYEDLREETDDDLTGTDLPIPSFAESHLSAEQRKAALRGGDPGQPAGMSAAVAAVVNRSKAEQLSKSKSTQKQGIFGVEVHNPEVLRDEFHPGRDAPPEPLRPETAADITATDVSIPGFAENTLSVEERHQALDAIRGGEARGPGRKPQGALPLNAAAEPVRSAPASGRKSAPLNAPPAGAPGAGLFHEDDIDETRRQNFSRTELGMGIKDEKTRDHVASLRERLAADRRAARPASRPSGPAILDELSEDEARQAHPGGAAMKFAESKRDDLQDDLREDALSAVESHMGAKKGGAPTAPPKTSGFPPPAKERS